jgi:hypothetical protein
MNIRGGRDYPQIDMDSDRLSRWLVQVMSSGDLVAMIPQITWKPTSKRKLL